MTHPDIHCAEQTGYGPNNQPIMVGDCKVCCGEMYDYEQTKCEDCDSSVHTGCIAECAQCGHEACQRCLKENTDYMEFFCQNNECLEQWEIEQCL